MQPTAIANYEYEPFMYKNEDLKHQTANITHESFQTLCTVRYATAQNA
jgi:hypothetical protein